MKIGGPKDMLLHRVPNVCGFVLLSMLVYLEMNLVPPFYSQSPSPLFFSPLVLDLGLATLVQCFVFFLRVLPTHFGIIQFLELFFFPSCCNFCVSDFV